MKNKFLHVLFLFIPIYCYLFFFEKYFHLFIAWYSQVIYMREAYKFLPRKLTIFELIYSYIDLPKATLAAILACICVPVGVKWRYKNLPINILAFSFLLTIAQQITERFHDPYSLISPAISYCCALILLSIFIPLGRLIFQNKTKF